MRDTVNPSALRTLPTCIRTIGLFLAACSQVIVFLATTATAAPPATVTPAIPPNVLILFTDDQRAKTIHALGNNDISTPNMDRLVHAGTAFPHAYIMGAQGGAVCCASRAMLMTGADVHHLTRNGAEISKADTMMGETLHANGYQTYAVGKWHNGTDSFMRCFQDGDEIMFGGMTASQYKVPLCHYHKDGNYPETPLIDRIRKDLPVLGDHVYPGKHSSQIFADAAVKFLDDKRTSSPFFLYVAFTAPHDPRQSPPEYANLYDASKMKLEPNFMPQHPFDNGHMHGRDEVLLGFPRKPDEVKKEIKDYYGAISYLDSQIGRILDTLKQTGQYNNTIIIFAGDNGLALGQHGLLGKQSLYEHSAGVPMIWSGPGIAKDKRSVAYCYLTDIFPTLCDLLKIKAPAPMAGRSFIQTLADPQKPARTELFFSFGNIQRAVSDTRYKLIEYNVKKVRHTQLFDLQSDPWEMKNLADDPQYAPIKQRLRNDLLKHKSDTEDNTPFWKGF